MQRLLTHVGHQNMKQLVSITVIALFFISCKKDNVASVRTALAGEWEITHFSAFPFFSTPYPAGNGGIIVFGKNGRFERKQHDTLLFKGNYLLHERKDCLGDEKQVFLETDDPGFVKDFYITITNDQLSVNSPNCYQDGAISTYNRLSKPD